MPRTRLGRAALVSLSLGTITVACTPGGQGAHVAALGDTPRADADEARLAAKARAALAKKDVGAAIRYAERATAAAPDDAAMRMLLGQAYLAAGRFASAEASFRDSLALKPAEARTRFDLALAEIAEGRSADALAELAMLDGQVPDADLGLATAIAGNRTRAIAMLSDVVRAGRSDARTRQNLALAFALDGRWREARGVAMQDTAPDRINDQIAGWASLAGSNDPRRQVAAMLGSVPAAADPGMPMALTLAAPIVTLPAPAPQPVALALAPPVLAPAPAAPSAVVAPVETAAVATTLPAAIARPAVPALIAAPVASPQRTAGFVRVAPRMPLSPGPLLRRVERGGWVVQLGAFARAGALETAWSRASQLSPHIATFRAVSGRTTVAGATLVRLSIGGLVDRAQATDLCHRIRARGGVCFVRAAGNDMPWQWARRDLPGRLAMADVRAG